MEDRTCKGACGRTLQSTEENFYFRKSSKNGKFYPSPYCRLCEKEKSAKSRRDKYATPDGKALILQQNLAYRDMPERREAARLHQNQKYALDAEFREYVKELAISWYRDNPNNKLRKKERARLWFQKHKPRLREEWNERFRTDPSFRLRNNLRHAIWEALRYNGGSKGGRSILSYLPYSMKELRKHLESLWELWMTWNNYGALDSDIQTWQIDHVIPQALLPYDDFSHPNFSLCWALTNLRPLESSKNIQKGCRQSALLTKTE